MKGVRDEEGEFLVVFQTNKVLFLYFTSQPDGKFNFYSCIKLCKPFIVHKITG